MCVFPKHVLPFCVILLLYSFFSSPLAFHLLACMCFHVQHYTQSRTLFATSSSLLARLHRPMVEGVLDFGRLNGASITVPCAPVCCGKPDTVPHGRCRRRRRRGSLSGTIDCKEMVLPRIRPLALLLRALHHCAGGCDIVCSLRCGKLLAPPPPCICCYPGC